MWLWQALVGGNPARTVSFGLTGSRRPRRSRRRLTLSPGRADRSRGRCRSTTRQASPNGAAARRAVCREEAVPAQRRASRPRLAARGGSELSEVLDVGDAGAGPSVFGGVSVKIRTGARRRAAGPSRGPWAQGGTVEVAGLNRSPAVLDVTLGRGGGSLDLLTPPPFRPTPALPSLTWPAGCSLRSSGWWGSRRVPVRCGSGAEAGHRYVVLSPQAPPALADRARASLDDGRCREPGGLPRDRPRPPWARRSRCCCAGRARGSRRGRWRSRRSRRCSGRASPRRRRSGTFIAARISPPQLSVSGYVVLLGDQKLRPQAFPASLARLRCRRCGRRRATCGRCRTRAGGERRGPIWTWRSSGGFRRRRLWSSRRRSLKSCWPGRTRARTSGATRCWWRTTPDVAGYFEADVADIRASYLSGRPTEVLKLRELGAGMQGAIPGCVRRGREPDELRGSRGCGGRGRASSSGDPGTRSSWTASSSRVASRAQTMNCLNGYFERP